MDVGGTQRRMEAGVGDLETQTKRCKQCERDLPLGDFYAHPTAKDGVSPYCKEDQKRLSKASRYRTYGVTEEQVDDAISAQKGRCAICSEAVTTLHVDHDHKTGNFRKMLCQSCNLMLGHASDSVERLKAGVEYLEAHSSEQ